jgi:hypothetical protein
MIERFHLTWGVAFYGWRARHVPVGRRERGEGVISAAIAVLIMAFIGAAMWVAFNTIWSNSEQRINDNVESIGGG